jgi:hypothetical protein
VTGGVVRFGEFQWSFFPVGLSFLPEAFFQFSHFFAKKLSYSEKKSTGKKPSSKKTSSDVQQQQQQQHQL